MMMRNSGIKWYEVDSEALADIPHDTVLFISTSEGFGLGILKYDQQVQHHRWAQVAVGGALSDMIYMPGQPVEVHWWAEPTLGG